VPDSRALAYDLLRIQCPRSERGLELLVIVSALGIWCFDNWTDSVQWAVRSLRPVVEALMVSLRDRAETVASGQWLVARQDEPGSSPATGHRPLATGH
jgi:hypothetical protein